MANQDERILLQADLFENLLTEVGGDYIAKIRTTGTVRNANIATRILARGSEYRKETIENILTMADQEKAIAISQGKSVIDGVGQYLLQLKGNFEGETAPFDSSKHSLVVGFTPGKELRNQLKEVGVQTNKATTGPVINTVTDPSTGLVNESISASLPLVLDGANIKIAGESQAGVFFISADETTTKSALLVVHNNPSQLTVVAPALADGDYFVEVRTHFAGSNHLVKALRTYRYPLLLTVGETGGDDRPEII